MILFTVNVNPPVPLSVAGRTIFLRSREVTSEWLDENGLGVDWCRPWVESGLLTPVYHPSESPPAQAPEPEPAIVPETAIPSEKPKAKKKADPEPAPDLKPESDDEGEVALTAADLLAALPKNLMQATPDELKAVLVAFGVAEVPASKAELIKAVADLRTSA